MKGYDAFLDLCIRLPVLLVLAGWFSLAAAASVPTNDPSVGVSSAASPVTTYPTAPVTVDGKVLFEVRGVTGYPADERAAAIASRIVAVARARDVSATSLRVVQADDASNILTGSFFVMRVVDADAVQAGVSRGVLARVFTERISAAVKAYRHDRSPAVLSMDTLYAAAATLAVFAAFWAGAWSFRRVEVHIEQRYRSRFRDVKVKSVPVIHAQQLWAIWRNALRAMRWALGLIVLYTYVHFTLGLYPWTRPLAAGLLAALTEPLGAMAWAILGYLPKLVFLGLLVLLTRYLLRVLSMFFGALHRGTVTVSGFEPEWGWPTYRIVRVLVVAFAAVIAYPYIPGSGSEAFKGVSIFLGVIISLGSSSVIANMIAGYTMTYRRAFRVGDWIQIGRMSGGVVDTGVLVTRLRSLKNEEIVVPNSLILNSSVVNRSTMAKERGLILHTKVGIGYEVPWRQVNAMLLMAAGRTPGLRPEPSPFVLQSKLGEFAVEYELNAYCDRPETVPQLYTELHQNMLDVFNEYGVQIMTPAYEQDTQPPKVVPRERWFASPATDPRKDPGR